MARRNNRTTSLPADEAAGLHEAMVRIGAQAVRDLTGAIHAQRNRGFKQVYAPCWRRQRDLLANKGSTLPARLYGLLIEHSGSTSAVVASYAILAHMLGCSPRSVVRAAEVLVAADAVRRLLPNGEGGSYCWALNPAEVWGGWAGGKEIAPFHTLTLVPLGDADDPVAAQRAVPTLLPRPKRQSAHRAATATVTTLQGDSNDLLLSWHSRFHVPNLQGRAGRPAVLPARRRHPCL